MESSASRLTWLQLARQKRNNTDENAYNVFNQLTIDDLGRDESFLFYLIAKFTYVLISSQGVCKQLPLKAYTSKETE